MHRREFLVSTVAASLLHAESGEPRTFVYKEAGGCEIKADAYGAGDGKNRGTRLAYSA